MIISTAALTKITTTRAHIQRGDIIDGARVTHVGRWITENAVRVQFEHEDWGPWLPATWHISVWR